MDRNHVFGRLALGMTGGQSSAVGGTDDRRGRTGDNLYRPASRHGDGSCFSGRNGWHRGAAVLWSLLRKNAQ